MYEYRCEQCGTDFERKMSFDDMLLPEREPCPTCTRASVKKVILTAPGLADSIRMGRIKPDSGFKEVLHKIHENTPGSTLKHNSSHY
jgi:putative FmdB family regulatory protein